MNRLHLLLPVLAAGAAAVEESATPPALVAQRSAPAAAPSDPWSLRVRTFAGYDTNVLLEPADAQLATDESSAVLHGDANAAWRTKLGRETHLRLGVEGAIDDYADVPEAQLARLGANAFLRQRLGESALGAIDAGVLLNGHRFWLDGDSAASDLGATLVGIATRTRHVDVAMLGWQHIGYDDFDDASGDQLELGWKHQFLLGSAERTAAGRLAKRIDAGLRAVTYRAETDDESYVALAPTVEVAWRIDAAIAGRALDLGGRVGWESRRYDEGLGADAAERQGIWRLRANADMQIAGPLSGGLFAAYGRRDSNLDARDYDRTQVGIQIAATF